MSRKAADVARGTRGPIVRGGEQVVETGAAPAASLPAPAKPKKPGFRRFVSPGSTGYRLTVTMPESYRDPKTGRQLTEKGKTAVFRESYFETDDEEIIARILNSNAFKNSEIRDLDIEEEKQRADAVESLVAIVAQSGDPDVRAKVLEALGAVVKEDFDLPDKEEKKSAD